MAKKNSKYKKVESDPQSKYFMLWVGCFLGGLVVSVLVGLIISPPLAKMVQALMSAL